jgi:hypothetical protein
MTEELVFSGFAAAALLLGWGLWWQRRARRVGDARNTLHGALAACRLLLRLLMLLQQHRGLSSGWLAGNQGFAERMVERRREIDELLPRLADAVREDQESACPCITSNALRLFRFRWRETVEGLARASVEHNIAEHGALIGEVLEWLSGLGEARIALLAPREVPAGLADNFAHRLPALSECLGQARAIGSSVAARRACSPVGRVRLLFLIGRAEGVLGRAWNAGEADSTQRRAGEAARRAVEELTAMVRTQMLSSAGVMVSPDVFFQTATRGIDAVFSWIDACGAELEGRLTAGFPAPAGGQAQRLALDR